MNTTINSNKETNTIPKFQVDKVREERQLLGFEKWRKNKHCPFSIIPKSCSF